LEDENEDSLEQDKSGRMGENARKKKGTARLKNGANLDSPPWEKLHDAQKGTNILGEKRLLCGPRNNVRVTDYHGIGPE